MSFALRSQMQLPQPKLYWSGSHFGDRFFAPLWQNVLVEPGAIHPRRRMTSRHSLQTIALCDRSRRGNVRRRRFWDLRRWVERLRCPPSRSLGWIFRQGSNLFRATFSLFPPKEIPSFSSFVKNHTTCFVPCCPFHCSILSAGRTDGVVDVSTEDSRRAASKSACRKRHTRRLVPDSAKAFTLPCRTQSRSVRTFTLRYRAASSAVSHSVVRGTSNWLEMFIRLQAFSEEWLFPSR